MEKREERDERSAERCRDRWTEGKREMRDGERERKMERETFNIQLILIRCVTSEEVVKYNEDS